MKKILTNLQKKNRVVKRTQKVGLEQQSRATNLKKSNLKANKERNVAKRLRQKRKALAEIGPDKVPSSKTLKTKKGKVDSKITNVDELSPKQLHAAEVATDKAIEKQVEALEEQAAASFKKANETSDAFTMTEAQRKDLKTKSGAGKIAATGGVLFGLIDPALRAQKQLNKQEHVYDMERDKQLFEYLFTPNKEGGK